MSIKFRLNVKKSDFAMSVEGEIRSQGVTALFGPSGSGKTTFLRAIAGLEHNVVGYLQVNDEIWLDDNINLPAHHRAIGYVFQQPGLFPHLNVHENILFGRNRRPGNSVDLDEIIQILALEPLLNRRVTNLSGGEQQRVAIARALASNPRFLLLDEPMSSLDSLRKQEIMPFLDKLPAALSVPIILVSHSQREVGHLADDILVIEKGKVIASGKTEQVMTRSDLPLFQQEDAMSVVPGKVAQHDDKHHMTRLRTSAGEFWIKRLNIAPDQHVRLQIKARDVSISTDYPQNTSILNVIPGIISEILPLNEGQVMVKVRCQEHLVLSRITRKSCELLDLKQELPVFIQVKSVAVLS